MSEKAKRFGLPQDLEAEQAAQALERAARDIRLGNSAEADLIHAIEAQQAAKRDDELMRNLTGAGSEDER
jgi:hypothetical protein